MLKRIVIILISIIRSAWFNFRYLPFFQACRLPILIAPNLRIKNMWRGGIVMENVKFGIAHIGFHEADAVDIYSARTVIDIRKGGIMECQGDIHIGHGALICVKETGYLKIGSNFAISGTTRIICSDRITIGDNVQFSWDSLVMDSDAHTILDINGNPLLNHKEIKIGSNVWIAANNIVLKGTEIGDNCVVGINSLLNRKYDENNIVIAGNPARKIKNISGWHL